MHESEGMHYEGNIIRPPSEAFSILLQVTLGCSHNKCTFCGTYKDKRFTIKDDDTILADILFASKYMRKQHRLFLIDGDALIIPQPKLVWFLHDLILVSAHRKTRLCEALGACAQTFSCCRWFQALGL